MRASIRLSPSQLSEGGLPEDGRWPPLAPEPPGGAEVAAHVARQVAPARPGEAPAPESRSEPGCGSGPDEQPAPAVFEEEASAEPAFVPVAPFGRPDPEVRAATMRLVDAIGLHLVCPEKRCRRARRCVDPDEAQLPLCFWLHRGTCRFVLAGLLAQPEIPAGDRAGARHARRGGSGATLLGELHRAGLPMHSLARTRADGADEWAWETTPEAGALLDELRRER